MTLKDLTKINNYNEFNYNQFESNFKFAKNNKTPKIKEIAEIIEQLEYLEKNIFKLKIIKTLEYFLIQFL